MLGMKFGYAATKWQHSLFQKYTLFNTYYVKDTLGTEQGPRQRESLALWSQEAHGMAGA